MLKRIKSIVDFYVSWSPLLSLPIWLFTGLIVMAHYGYKSLILYYFGIWLLNWLFVGVYFETWNSYPEKDVKRTELLFSIYVTLCLVVSVYLFATHGSEILNALLN